MKNFAGTPGTITGLILRLFQCFFAVGSIASMATTKSFFNFTAFSYMIASMGLQVIWSFGLALLDACALANKKVLQNPSLLSLFVVGDWVSLDNKIPENLKKKKTEEHPQTLHPVTATLSLAAASSSAGITVLYFNDLGGCGLDNECRRYQLAVVLAFMSWITVWISSLIMFWTLAAG